MLILENFLGLYGGVKLSSEVLGAFSSLFDLYDDEERGAKIIEVVWGLALFCSGEKSDKLSFGFDIFDLDDADSLSEEQLFCFLSSMLKMILGTVEKGATLGKKEVLGIVDSASATLSMAVMEFVREQGHERVSFDDFGDWYNTGGFKVAPWLELLALRKWWTSTLEKVEDGSTGELQYKAGDSNGDEVDQDADEDEYVYGDGSNGNGRDDDLDDSNRYIGGDNDDRDNSMLDVSHGDGLTFSVLINSVSSVLCERVTFNPSDVARVRELVTVTGLYQMSFRTVCDSFLGQAEEGALSKESFDSCIRSLIPGSLMNDEVRLRLSQVISGIFFAFDRERANLVDAVEFAAGFSIFCAGSKSDKLAYAFEILDDDFDGKISRRGMWRFTRAFLTVLMHISSVTDEVDGQSIIDGVDGAAVWTAAEVFKSKEGRTKYIMFDDFADWYTEGGYMKTSWFELLDLHKWCL